MWRAAARRVKKAPSRFTLSTRCHSSVVISAKLAAAPRPETPAFTKQASIPPSVDTVWANAWSTAASSLTSHRSAMALAPVACRRARACTFLSSLVPQMQTAAPAWASASAMPRPMPLLPPVTIAVLPRRSNA
jgi:hypothetical protein